MEVRNRAGGTSAKSMVWAMSQLRATTAVGLRMAACKRHLAVAKTLSGKSARKGYPPFEKKEPIRNYFLRRTNVEQNAARPKRMLADGSGTAESLETVTLSNVAEGKGKPVVFTPRKIPTALMPS